MNGETNRGALSSALAELNELLGNRLSTADDERNRHARDVSHHPPQPPDAVVFPQSTGEVARIAAICTRHRVPMIPFGTGTAVEGGVLAVEGGVAIDLTRMNRILRVSIPDMDATVEAGVTRKQLNRSLLDRHTALHFPVDPGADASDEPGQDRADVAVPLHPSGDSAIIPVRDRYTVSTSIAPERIQVMAHKKGQGSTRNGRDSNGQRRGIKKFGGERVLAGNILARQCGTKWHPGRNVGMGGDYTLFSLVEGTVFFDRGGRRINVQPVETA